MYHIHRFLFAGVVLLTSLSTYAQGLDQSLVAKWTFKDGSLKSDFGDFVFDELGNGEVEAGATSVTLRGHKYLITPEVSSDKFPDLKKSVTIWARLKFDELPAENEANVFGFQAGQKAGDWADMVLSLVYRAPSPEISDPGFAFLAHTPDPKELGVGRSRMQPATAGEFMNVALVFDGVTGMASMWVNGVFASSQPSSVPELVDFGSFGIGQLKAPGTPITITFDEVRVYSVALEPQWLEEISADQ